MHLKLHLAARCKTEGAIAAITSPQGNQLPQGNIEKPTVVGTIFFSLLATQRVGRSAARGASAAMRSRARSKAASKVSSKTSSRLSRALVVCLASVAARVVLARPLDATASVALAFADGGRGDASRCACARRDDLRRKCAPVLREGALPRAEAEALRAEADGVAGGFVAKDEAYPTSDVDFERMSANARAMVSEKWWPIIVREIRERCGYSTDDFVSPYRVVVSRYGDEVRKIHAHADAGDVTFTVLLNDPSEFEGGGTKFFGRVHEDG